MRIKSVFVIAIAICAVLFIAAMSLSVPVSPRDHYACQQEAKTYGDGKPGDCPDSETIWNKSLKDPVAYYTAWLALFTLALATIGIAQSFLTDQQIALAREEFISSHRPKLRLRLLKLGKLEIDQPIRIEFQLANIGETPAKIVEVDITLRLDMVVPWFKDGIGYKDVTWSGKLNRTDKISPGESSTVSEELPVKFDPAWADSPPDERWQELRVNLIGTITYADDRGVKRRTAFYRMATDDRNRFVIPNLPREALTDYEFED